MSEIIYNKVYCDNWLNNNLPDKCAKLLICDPPYFEVKGEFDFIWKTFEDYLKDVEKWAIECKRVLADNGTLFWWGMDRKIAYSQIILDKYFNLIGTPVWEKPSNPNEWDTRRTFPERGAERLLMYSNEWDIKSNSIIVNKSVEPIRDYLRGEIIKSKGYIKFKDINICFGSATNGGGLASGILSTEKEENIMITEYSYIKLQKYCNPHLTKDYKYLLKEYEDLRLEYEEKRRYFNNELSLTDVFKFPREVNKLEHDTKKPEKLTRALILTCSRKGDLVVVPFAGSGTECAMAAKEGRQFIGFDIEQKYVDTSNRRCKLILNEPKLF
jgi:site-specific DNA-methyltransferase (adenine-specific)